MTASKIIDGVTVYLRSPRDLHSFGGDQYVWQSADGRAATLTEEEATEHGVERFLGLLTNPL